MRKTPRFGILGRHCGLAVLGLMLLPVIWLHAAEISPQTVAWFADPPPRFRSWPLYWLNAPLEPAALREQIQAMRDQCGFGGFTPLPMKPTKPAYLTDDYFVRYGEMLEQAEKLGMRVVMYDDIDFPGGSAGGRMAKQFPDDLLKNLQKIEEDVAGPARFDKRVPAGKLMAVVAMETASKARTDLAPFINDGGLHWDVPAGKWKVMFFVCVRGNDRLVDYMDPDAVGRFMTLTYDEYFKRFGRYFGKTIVMSFFDDLALVYTPGGRTWTPKFNEKFAAKFGRDPALLYPALWYDIGPETAAARVALFGIRADLMADGYVRVAHEWCKQRGIAVSGHPAGNYNAQPVEVSGDNIKFYKHCDVPLLDSIHFYGHGRPGFKLVTSASSTYDRPVTAVEIYGNYPDKTVDAAMLYRSAMELYVRGANLMIPHGMWYDPAKMNIPPEISHRNPRFGMELPAYNGFVGRCSLLLQGGRHVADIGVLYPVIAMQAAYQFDVPGKKQPNWGYDAPPEADYLEISDALTGRVRRDFTFLHPEIIDERCTVAGATIRLNNKSNFEQYQAIVIPGGKTISWSNLQKIRQFYDNGGRVIATTQLPSKSAEFGRDEDVRRTIREVFGIEPAEMKPRRLMVRIEVAGNTFKTFINKVLVDTTTDKTHKKGAVGLREADHESAVFRKVAVTTPAGHSLTSDDFAAGLDKWVNVAGATVNEGTLTLTENQLFRTRDGADWTDYAVDVEIDSASPVAGIVFRASDDRNCYMWQIAPEQNALRPHRKVNGNWAVLKKVNYSAMSDGVADYKTNTNAKGGMAFFAPDPTAGTLRAILDKAVPVPDIAFEGNPRLSSGGGMLSYLHKVRDGANVYYFANSTDEKVDAFVRIRGRVAAQIWDPHTGQMAPTENSSVIDHGVECTRVRLVLDAAKSVFIVDSKAARSEH